LFVHRRVRPLDRRGLACFLGMNAPYFRVFIGLLCWLVVDSQRASPGAKSYSPGYRQSVQTWTGLT
jgi:hypothetical protein